MTLDDLAIIRMLEAAAAALVSLDPIGALRLVLLASEWRAGWRV